MSLRIRAVAAIAAAAVALAACGSQGGGGQQGTAPARADTLARVKAQGYLRCGVSQGLAGFSNPDAQGNWTGIDVEFCRAIAAAIFDDPNAVRFVPLSSKERFTALQAGEFEVLSRNTTWTMGREGALGLQFLGVVYYDGQGFMVRKDSGITSAKMLDGAAICTQTGTTTELNLADFFRTNGLTYKVVAYEKDDEVVAAYDSGRCDAYTTDRSGLAADRLKMREPDAHLILPEVISKEPLGPLVRQDDAAWATMARWVLFALINAEELGITKANVQEKLASPNPEIRRLLGVEGDFGTQVGLTTDWAVRIVRHVGNYGEIFDRNLGPATSIGLERGQNALWTNGGLLYAPPVR